MMFMLCCFSYYCSLGSSSSYFAISSSIVFQSLLLSSTSSLELCAYSEADHGSDPIDRNSVTGFCIFLGDSFISWKSKKQSIIFQSSTEAEYRVMTSTTKEIVQLRQLLADMGVSFSHPTPMYCDNQSSIQRKVMLLNFIK